MAYALFSSEDYYPAGGMDDLVGVFETIEEAKLAALMERAIWGHIADMTSLTKVLEWRCVARAKRATKTRPATDDQWDWTAPAP